jgi:hypothetical protein
LWQVLLGFEAQDATLNLTKLMKHEPAPEKKGLLRLTGTKEGPLGWMQPVLTLLNKQFATFEDLSATTLQSLGLTSGTCLIRVAHVWTSRHEGPVSSVVPAAVVGAVAVVEGNNNNNNNNNNKIDDLDKGKEEADAKPDATANRPSKSQKTTEQKEEEQEEEQQPNVNVSVPEDRNVVVFEPNDAPFNPASFEIPG